MAGETHAHGTKFHWWDPDAGPAAWAQIANLTNVSGPGNTKDTLETTDLLSVDKFRTFISSLRDAGEVTLTMNWEYTEWDKLYQVYLKDTNDNFAIEIPTATATVIEFEGIVTACPAPENPFDGLRTSEITIKVSGKPTIDTTLDPIV